MGETIEGISRLVAEIAGSYGLTSVEDWRWIKEGGSPSVAMLRSGGRRFVARRFADEADLPRADYISRLALHLGSVGVEVEQVVPTVSGEPYARLPGRISVILSHFHPDPPVPVPFEATDARTWGRYVSGMHAACRGWRPPSPLPSPWMREEPGAVVERALELAATFRHALDILEGTAGRIIACWEGTPEAQPVHGDLWPGNLLAGPHGLRAIDFAEAGDGPRTIDMATAFRWMPWRDDPTGAAVSWKSWLAGYGEVGVISQAELDSIPPLACLQHLIWMIAEVVTSTGAAESSWYIEDHCSAVQVLLSSATT